MWIEIRIDKHNIRGSKKGKRAGGQKELCVEG